MTTVVVLIRDHITTARVNKADDCLRVSTRRRSYFKTSMTKLEQEFSNDRL